MNTADTTTEAFADTRPSDAADLPDFGDLGEALARTGWVAGELVGEPSAELKAKMASSGIRLFTPFLAL